MNYDKAKASQLLLKLKEENKESSIFCEAIDDCLYALSLGYTAYKEHRQDWHDSLKLKSWDDLLYLGCLDKAHCLLDNNSIFEYS